MAYRDSQPKTIYLKDYQVPDFFIDKTELHVDLGDSETRVQARLRMRRNPEAKSDASLILHGVDLEIVSLSIDDQVLAESAYRQEGEELIIQQQVPASFLFSSEVIIKPQENTSLEGLYKSRELFCTQCEAEGFRKITFYLDRPDVMAEFTTTIVADKSRFPVLLSNGNLIASGDQGDGRHWVTWHDPFVKPAYLFAMVAGDLKYLEDSFSTCSGREVCLRIFVEAKDLDKCSFAMDALKKSMKWDEDVYGREYDLDIFMIVAVDDFNAGAMENKGLNIFNSSAVLAKQEITTDLTFQNIEAIVAHEYFHNWSGNRVTCRDWFQLSLKEGFTVFRDSEFSSDVGSRAVKRVQDVNMLRTLQFAEDGGPMAHPVQPSSYMEISNFYTLTVYEKGCEVVRMIHTLLGPELFRKGSDLYFERHDGQAVTIEDFVAAMAEVSGKDFSRFMSWYKQAGTPEVRVEADYESDAKTYRLHFSQRCRPTPECQQKAPYLIPVKMGLVGPDGDMALDDQGNTEQVAEITEAEQSLVFENIDVRPVPSLFRGFSAPVKWHFPYSRDDLLFLMANDSDSFNRWEVCNQLALDIIKEMIGARQQGSDLPLDPRLIEAYRSVLADSALDKAMVSLMLSLPTESYLSEQMDIIPVKEIHQVRLAVRTALASALKEEFVACYRELQSDAPYKPEPEQIARRSLKNMVLAYLSLLDEPELLQQVYQQATTADNMTDCHSALVSLVNSPATGAQDLAQTALADFYGKWKNESLAINLWLQVQAGAMTPGGLERVKALMDHEAFDIKNPNRVRSLIGAFCSINAVNFHREDGAGYQFLGDRIVELNGLNPQIAARQLTPLTRWRKYPPKLADQMTAQLRRILKVEGLSPDVYEVVSKSLAD